MKWIIFALACVLLLSGLLFLILDMILYLIINLGRIIYEAAV